MSTLKCASTVLFVVAVKVQNRRSARISLNQRPVSAGFSGISLGATPAAIANMTAVAKVHGAAPMAFIILPLVSAFFIDIANAVAIGLFVR
jgi:sodium--glutamate symport carrier gltS